MCFAMSALRKTDTGGKTRRTQRKDSHVFKLQDSALWQQEINPVCISRVMLNHSFPNSCVTEWGCHVSPGEWSCAIYQISYTPHSSPLQSLVIYSDLRGMILCCQLLQFRFCSCPRLSPFSLQHLIISVLNNFYLRPHPDTQIHLVTGQ